MANIKEYLEKAEQVKPIAERNGRKIVTFEDQRNLATASNINKEHVGGLEWNKDGSLARTKGTTAAVNPEYMFANRYKKVKNKYYVVTDFRAIEGLETNSVPYRHITASQIGEFEGRVVCEKIVIISDEDFAKDFTRKLDFASMVKVLEAINDVGSEKEADKLEF